MKILYDYQIFLRQKYGGISRYFFELISNLIDNNDLYLFFGKYINQQDLYQFKEKSKYFNGRKIRFIHKTKLPNLFFNKISFKKAINKIKIDIYHLTYYDNSKLKNKAKKIVTVHDMTHEKFPDNFSKLDNTIKLKKEAIQNADGIICISNTTKNDLLNLYNINEEKIRVIYHGNSLKYEVNEEAIMHKPYLLYVGDRRAYKNFDVVLEAFKNSDSIRKNFILLCFGGGKFKSKEKELINEYGLSGLVFHKEGSDRELANAYKYASAFIYPSLYEGFGIPLLEAMHYGSPIVASKASCFPEIAGDAALYFEPTSAEDLVLKIEKIISDSETRSQLIKNGYEREKQFGWDKCATHTYEFYKDILNL